MHNCGYANDEMQGRIDQAARTLSKTASVLGQALRDYEKANRYRIRMRFYHGWTKEFEATPNRKALVVAAAQTDFSVLSRSPQVVFSPNIEFGDVLLSALSERLCSPRGIHLPGTLRENDGGGRVREKMVDTALCADLLTQARYFPSDWSVVIAEDDDLVPPVLTAEAWQYGTAGRVLLLRKREPQRSVLKLDRLKLKGRW